MPIGRLVLRTRKERRGVAQRGRQEQSRQAGARQDKRQTDAILDCALNRTSPNQKEHRLLRPKRTSTARSPGTSKEALIGERTWSRSSPTQCDHRESELPPKKELSNCSRRQNVRLRVCHRRSLRDPAAVPNVRTRENKTIKSLDDDKIVKLPVVLAMLSQKVIRNQVNTQHLTSPVNSV